MESPSAQLILQGEASMLDGCGPPSSPFVSEVETQSRVASRQWHDDKPAKPQLEPGSPLYIVDDKENVPHGQGSNRLKTTLANTPERNPTHPRTRPSTPQTSSMLERNSKADRDMDIMPPPISIRRTPRRTPLKLASSSDDRSNTATRGDAHASVDEKQHSVSAFQAGLDMRSASVQSQEHNSGDDTCFTSFSEIPDMTVFAKLRQSPTRTGSVFQTPGRMGVTTPRTSRKRASPSRSPSPTPRRQKTPAATAVQDGTASFLIDFTQQIEGTASYRPTSPVKSATESNLLRYINGQRSPAKTTARPNLATPSKPSNILNLLDFELPPAPTPRSVPTITVRELESLKSSYMSQISSLKATLSGREAEVESLKRAIGDAERRAGEAQESLREENCRREEAEQERAEWERRGKEVETVLRSVKEEVIKSEAEKEDMLRKLEDAEKRVEDAETRTLKAEERFADALAARAGGGQGTVDDQVQRLVAAQIDAKIEAVSRELHGVYKEKHERKVATLKKSYEARSEKKCADLQAKVLELERQNEELAAGNDVTFSGPVAKAAGEAELKAHLEEQKAALARLDNQLLASKQQQDHLMQELQQERIEKGDLVAAVDEMLALQAEQGPAQGAMSVVEDFRKSISRPSGLRAPAGVAAGGNARGNPAQGLGRSVNGGKSRMLANIERMGRTGGASTANTE